MADNPRVEELRKRYHENPRRFFAPLANEYRKSGFLDRAILLCEKHLGEQPGNLNGLIVYGQTLFEAGRHGEAKVPLTAALEVDRENLIALRHLGDIARLGGDAEDARAWYLRVLEFDRRNEEVRGLLEQVGGAPEEPPSGAARRSMISVSPNVVASVIGGDEGSTGGAAGTPASGVDLASAKTVEVTPRRATPPAPTARGVTPRTPTSAPRAATPRTVTPARPSRATPRASLLDISFDFNDLAPEPSSKPAAPVPPPPAPLVELPDEIAPLADFAPNDVAPLADLALGAESLIERPSEEVVLGDVEVRGLELAEFSADVEPLAGLESDQLGSDVSPLADLETAEFEATPISVPRVEGFREEESTTGIAPLEALETAEFEVPADAETSPLADLESELFVPDAIEIPAPARAESGAPPIVTETMAELYLRQGFRAEAIQVYRQLVQQDPSDEGMRAKLAALENDARDSLGFETPPDGTAETAETPAPNAMLAEVSFEEVAIGAPPPARVPTPRAVPRVAGEGPTAREFFAAFARRAATPVAGIAAHRISPEAAAYAIPATLSPLDDLFGVEVHPEDQRAANTLAGVGTITAPSGASTLDVLFGSDSDVPFDDPPTGVRATEKLKFDAHYSASSSPSAEGSSAPRPPVPEEDLDKFQDWLKGLAE